MRIIRFIEDPWLIRTAGRKTVSNDENFLAIFRLMDLCPPSTLEMAAGKFSWP